MKLSRFAASAAVVSILAVSMGAGAAAPATAAPLHPASAVLPPGSGWNPKQYMINVLSSMLSGAGGDSASKRAVIAADQVFDHSWESLEQQWKMKSAIVPSSYDDYVLQRQEHFLKNNLTSTPGELAHPNSVKKKWVKPMRPPATKALKVLKGVGGVVGGTAAFYAFDQRANISAGFAEFVGVDNSTGATCANSKFLSENGETVTAGFQNWITGVDCEPFAFAEEYNANAGIEPGFSSLAACTPDGSNCVRVKGTSSRAVTTSGSSWGPMGSIVQAVCTETTKGPPAMFTFLKLESGMVQKGDGYYYHQDTGWWASNNPCEGFAWPAATSHRQPVDPIVGVSMQPTEALAKAPGGLIPVEPTSTDPERVLTCTITGTDGQQYTVQSPTFTESTGGTAEPNCPVLPADVGAANVKLTEDGGGQSSTLVDSPTTPEYQAWWAAYPECREGACSLDLTQKPSGQSCFADAASSAACAAWLIDPLKADNYQCMYGTHAVSLSECNVYGDVFKPEKVLTGQPYTDPLTGLPVTGQSSPGASKSTLNRVALDPRDFRGCLDNGWAAANPVEWVMVPVTCSMQSSFVPRTGFVDGQLTKVALTWANTGPAKLAASVGAWKIAPNVAGCESSMDFPVPMVGKTIHVPIIQACPGTPFGDFAPFIRGLVSAVLIITAGFACKRIVAGWIA